jgi:hypothetical protein
MTDIKEIMKVMKLKGYTVFENDSKNMNINYVGIRDISDTGKINDLFVVFWKYKGRWNQLWSIGTTDPGKHYEQNLLNSKGVAILKEGQYRGAWTLGKHQGKYTALVQAKEVTVIRDKDKDGKLETDGVEDTGWHGINHHRMHSTAEVSKVGKYSAEEVWGKGISYTLLNVNDFG